MKRKGNNLEQEGKKEIITNKIMNERMDEWLIAPYEYTDKRKEERKNE